MDNELKKIYTYMGIFVSIILIGASYAFFTAGISAETTTTVQADAGTMKITYSGGNNINLNGIYPRDEVWATKEITVTGNNTTDAEMYYKLTLKIDSNTFSASDPLQYELVSTNTSTNGEVIPAISKTDITSSTYELGNGHFIKANSAKHTYQLKIYYPKKTTSQNDNQGATFNAHVEIESLKVQTTTATFAQTILANNKIETPLTTPGKEVSTDSEALLASAEDDYGTSYYFRGAVKNNYVEFANKCWRIVRIVGDDSVKLVLHNDNTSNAGNPCSSSNNSDIGAFTGLSVFNESGDDNAYVGFMYGTAGSSDYASTHANTNKSTILTNLETWYTDNLAAYSNKIANTVWCNDKTNIANTNYNPFSLSDLTGLGYNKNVTYYNSMLRLTIDTSYSNEISPDLRCIGELSKIHNKIGLLTIDEIIFAGYASRLKATSSFLSENSVGAWWWTISPLDFADGSASLWVIDGMNARPMDSFVNDGKAVRPSISLASSVTATGSGTSEDPYKID